MAEGKKYPLEEAKGIAAEILLLLIPHCIRIEVAGSIRREKKEVSDIEIVCIPKPYEHGLFEDGLASVVNQWEKVKGEMEYGKCKYTQRILPMGIKLDLFMTDHFDYFRQLAIRTGSADYSFKVIAQGWLRMGWCGSDAGLRKISDCTRVNDKWKCVNGNAQLPPVWQSEEEFFKWIKAEYLLPKDRN